MVEQLAALSLSGIVGETDLPAEILSARAPESDVSLRSTEKQRILDALSAANGNLAATARSLGIARSTLYLKLDAYGIERPARGAH